MNLLTSNRGAHFSDRGLKPYEDRARHDVVPNIEFDDLVDRGDSAYVPVSQTVTRGDEFVLMLPATGRTDDVAEKRLLDNERVAVYEYVFPAGFRGDEHAAVADEFAYVLDGEFTVVTKGRGKTVVRRGEIEYAAKDTIHYSLNESKKPARVLVVLLKER